MIKWKRIKHPVWDKTQPSAFNTKVIAEYRYSTKDPYFSILPPCEATHGEWELYDGEDIWTFKTLKEAKAKAETLNLNTYEKTF